MTINERIVEIAKSYIGITEIKPNAGFSCPVFEAEMRSVDWEPGHPWCTYFTELVWKKAYKGTEHEELLSTLFSGYAILTIKNFRNCPIFKVSEYPEIGSIAIWEHGFTGKGHAGIVIKKGMVFETVDGNSGDKVSQKIRHTGMPHTADGFNLLGFIHPI